ncbi:MAG: amidohydrolase family protein [Prevotellaceae bacterium]|jgi:cytosine/adenosine deaminase-related metal-dependent hydrolase|nr:amidohydrolase family protein [Prevotellaceae bacterium]
MRKIAAHYIFPITSEPIKNGILTLDDDGTVLDLSQSNENLTEAASVEFYNGILVPGFVNAHCHLELSHMQGVISQGSGMGNFCKAIIAKRNFITLDEQQRKAFAVDKQMFAEGIVAVGDISNGTSSFNVKRQSPLYYHTFVEYLGFDDSKADKIIQQALTVQNEAEQALLAATITPHAPYSMSEKLFAESVALAKSAGILSIHNQESADEMELFASDSGGLRGAFKKQAGFSSRLFADYSNPIDRILKYIDPDTGLLLIHNVYTTNGDIERTQAVNSNATWVLCPNSNLYIENTLPDVMLFYRRGVNIAVGTDSFSSNTSISVLDELKTLNLRFPQIPLHTLLLWATLGGAKALKKDSVFGSFDIGKQPGVTLIEGVDFDNMRLILSSKSTRLLH